MSAQFSEKYSSKYSLRSTGVQVPVTTIPLVGNLAQRGLMTRTSDTAGQDEKYINCIVTEFKDPLKQSRSLYLEKRQGMESFSVPASGSIGNAVFARLSAAKVISVFSSAGTYSIYSDTTNCGVIDDFVVGIIEEGTLGSVSYVMFTTNAGTGWFLPSDAVGSFTFTGDTHTNTTIDNVSSLTGLYVGQKISGTGIQSGTRIATITPPSTITTTLATTATNAGVTITREGVAKIIDADFPSNAMCLTLMDGFFFTADITNSRISNSDLNSITAWTSGNAIPVSISSDSLSFVAKYRNRILGAGAAVFESFANAGNPSNSPLVSKQDELISIGASPSQRFAQVNDYLFFVGPITLNPGIWMLSSNGPKKISTPAIDRHLSSSSTFGLKLAAFPYAGYTYLLFNADSGAQFLYCVELDYWTKQVFGVTVYDANGTRRTGNTAGPFFVGGDTIYVWDGTPTYQDGGVAYTMTAQTDSIYLNKGRPFSIRRVGLVGDKQSSGSATLSTSGNNYGSWDSRGTFDYTLDKMEVWRCGYFKSAAAFKVDDAGNNAARWQALEVEWEPCTA